MWRIIIIISESIFDINDKCYMRNTLMNYDVHYDDSLFRRVWLTIGLGVMALALTSSCAARSRLFEPQPGAVETPAPAKPQPEVPLPLPVIPPQQPGTPTQPVTTPPSQNSQFCIPYISCEFASAQVMDLLTPLQNTCMEECQSMNRETAARGQTLAQLLQEKCSAPCGGGYDCEGSAQLDCGAQCQVPLSRCGFVDPVDPSDPQPTDPPADEVDDPRDEHSLVQHSFFTTPALCEAGVAGVPVDMINRLCLKKPFTVRFEARGSAGSNVERFSAAGKRDLRDKYLKIRAAIKLRYISWEVIGGPAWLPDERIKFQLPQYSGRCFNPISCKGQVIHIPSGREHGRGNFQEHVGVKVGVFPNSAALNGRCLFKMQLFDKRFDDTLATTTAQDALVELIGSC